MTAKINIRKAMNIAKYMKANGKTLSQFIDEVKGKFDSENFDKEMHENILQSIYKNAKV